MARFPFEKQGKQGFGWYGVGSFEQCESFKTGYDSDEREPPPIVEQSSSD